MKSIKELAKEVEVFAQKMTWLDPKFARNKNYDIKVELDQTMTIKERTELQTLIMWCNKHCTSKYSYDGRKWSYGTRNPDGSADTNSYLFSFTNANDAMLFKLTWR